MKNQLREFFVSGSVLSLCAVVTIFFYIQVDDRQKNLNQEYNAIAADALVQSISIELVRTVASLKVVGVMLGSLDQIDRAEFDRLSAQLFSSVQPLRTLEWAKKKQGTSSRVNSSKSLDAFPTIYSTSSDWEATDEDNLTLLKRSRAMKLALASGEPIASPIQVSKDDPNGSQFDIVVAVVSNVDAKQSSTTAVKGYFVATISVAAFLNEAIFRAESQQMKFAVFDTNSDPKNLIFGNLPFADISQQKKYIRYALDVAGNPWELRIYPNTEVDPQPTRLVLTVGVLITILVMGLLMVLRNVRRNREQEAMRARELRTQQEKVAFARDLADQVAVLERRRGLGEMAFAFGHEISQPLTAINSYAQFGETLLSSAPADKKQLQSIFKGIHKNAQRGARLLDRIRSYVKDASSVIEPVDLGHVLHDVIELLAAEVRRLEVTTHVQVRSKNCRVMGDGLQLSQALVNVFRNAIQAASATQKKEVMIDLSTVNGVHKLTVRDFGQGFSELALEKAGTPFFTNKPNGLGLGLSIARRITELSDGTLTLKNAIEGGAVVELTFPAAP